MHLTPQCVIVIRDLRVSFFSSFFWYFQREILVYQSLDSPFFYRSIAFTHRHILTLRPLNSPMYILMYIYMYVCGHVDPLDMLLSLSVVKYKWECNKARMDGPSEWQMFDWCGKSTPECVNRQTHFLFLNP